MGQLVHVLVGGRVFPTGLVQGVLDRDSLTVDVLLDMRACAYSSFFEMLSSFLPFYFGKLFRIVESPVDAALWPVVL